MAGERLLVLEDDPLLLTVLTERLRREGLEVTGATTLAEARAALDLADPDVALIDLRLPDGEGLELLREYAPKGQTVWVVMTAHATVSSAVEALKLGAKDYLEKPFTLDRAVATIRQALEMTALRREVAALRDRSSHAGTTVIGESPAMKRVFELVERLAAVDATTVLIEGESGTGKGAIAQALHRLSRRANGPFLNVTSSALPETLMESELFGHEKGAFTDAHAAKRGLVEMADGGTLFLDEVGELTPGVQAKLLRFIEEKTFRRLGGTRDLVVDVRIMAATNRDLAAEVAAGRFRADLFYRLRVIPITLPPLRERREDILPLVKHFVAHFDREFGKKVREIVPEAQAMLNAYAWPGNVRELRNVIERAVLLADGETIGPRELPPEVAAPMTQPAAPAAALPSNGVKLDEVERRLLVEALDRAHGNQSHAAELLGLSRHQVRTRMKRYGLMGLAVVAAAVFGLPAGAAAQRAPAARGGAASSLTCLRCHSSREFLEQAVPTGQFRLSLVVTPDTGAGRAHAALPCVACHVGALQFPHRPEAATPIPCTSCHAVVSAALQASVHGEEGRRLACTACHGAHGVGTVAWLATAPGRAAMNASCAACHAHKLPEPGDVHATAAGCMDCHGGHAIEPLRDPATHGVPLAMARRCAACHRAEAAQYWMDVHGQGALEDAASPAPLGRDTSATCVDCHQGHAVRVPADSAAHFAFAETCTRCHPAYGATFRGNYHGQATQVGSRRAALCANCHTAHSVYPASDPRSSVSAGRRILTCRRCHPAASGRFADYRPHADPTDPARNPGLFALWLAMVVLLAGVTAVYLVHAVLVSRRTTLERRAAP
ncbi:MAG TPA: sigma 54-interacting transcriptional regulator [Gemmatimonadales bacterium]|nr:sigma 54-interacting transcriptional regulator [Gemmatimonadales bacterium]